MELRKVYYNLVLQVLLQIIIIWTYALKEEHGDKNAAILPFFISFILMILIQGINAIANIVALKSSKHRKKIIVLTTVLLSPIFVVFFDYNTPFGWGGVLLTLIFITGNAVNLLIFRKSKG